MPVIALAMGERGVPSRLLASKFGSHLTFGCLGAGRGTAPGQFSMQDLLLYRVGGQCSKTQVSIQHAPLSDLFLGVKLAMHY